MDTIQRVASRFMAQSPRLRRDYADGFDRFASDYDDLDGDFEYRMAKGRGRSKQKKQERVKRYKRTRRLLEKKYKDEPWWIVWKAYEGTYKEGVFNNQRFRQNLKKLGLDPIRFKKLKKYTGEKGKELYKEKKKQPKKRKQTNKEWIEENMSKEQREFRRRIKEKDSKDSKRSRRSRRGRTR